MGTGRYQGAKRKKRGLSKGTAAEKTSRVLGGLTKGKAAAMNMLSASFLGDEYIAPACFVESWTPRKATCSNFFLTFHFFGKVTLLEFLAKFGFFPTYSILQKVTFR